MIIFKSNTIFIGNNIGIVLVFVFLLEQCVAHRVSFAAGAIGCRDAAGRARLHIQLAYTFRLSRVDGEFARRTVGRAIVPLSSPDDENYGDGHDYERGDDPDQGPEYWRHVKDDGLSRRTH